MKKRWIAALMTAVVGVYLCLPALAMETEMPDWLRPPEWLQPDPGIQTPVTTPPAQDTSPNDIWEMPGWLLPDDERDPEGDQQEQEQEEPSNGIPAGVTLMTTNHTAYLTGSDGNFSPEANLTRAQTAQILYRLLPESAKGRTVSFSDVSPAAWYAQAVGAMGALGVMGQAGGAFGPEVDITRGEFIRAVAQFFPLRTDAAQFSDVSAYHSAAPYILSARASGWITGFQDGTFRPDQPITRAEAAATLNRALGRSADKSYVDNNYPLCFYRDVSPSDWYYYDVMEAAVAHRHVDYGIGETWSTHTPIPSGISSGLYLVDGWLYRYDAATGTVARSTTVDGLTFGASGRFTSGSAELDEKLRAIVLAETNDSMTQEQKLRALYVYTRDSFTYLRRPAYEFGATDFMLKDALDMLNTGYGNCYSYASVFWYLSRWIGYDAKIYSGTVGTNYRPHSWVEINMGGRDYIYDTELEMAYHQRGRYDIDLYKYIDVDGWHYVKP